LAQRPHFLILGETDRTGPEWLQRLGLEGEVARAPSWSGVLESLRRHGEDALVTLPDGEVIDSLAGLIQAREILTVVPEGAAVVDFDLRIRWANPAFIAWCQCPPVGRGFYEAVGAVRGGGSEFCPFHTALAHLPPAYPADGLPVSIQARLQVQGGRWLDLTITPLRQAPGEDRQLVVLGRDVTGIVVQQQKITALHKAGRELAAIPPDQLAEMSIAERVEVLKHNILKSTRDILHYDVIEIRLLDPRTGNLELLLQEGMTNEAVGRTLSAGIEGNGVTGYVAATRTSYLCRDTTADPIYLPGAPGAHSSLTVPLIFQDRVIGTMNVESPQPNAFGEDDLQFAEEFSHEVAAALTTLELLSVEKSTTASQSIEAITREVGMPVDEILQAASSLLDRYIAHDADMADKLRRIIMGARAIKQVIQKVGEDLTPSGTPIPERSGAQHIVPSLKGKRVLVADNDDRIRRTAHNLLGRWGCIVETARDGREAVTMARLSPYDVILADIRLPDMNGYDVFRQLKEAQPQARIILMTEYGYDPHHSIVRARQDGGLHCALFKPIRVNLLLDALTGTSPVQPRPQPVGADPRPPGSS
jgi:CheY-like chemotaxis protein/GAF domain-containing protein